MNGEIPEERELILKTLKITGLNGVGNGDGSDLQMQIIMNGEVKGISAFRSSGGAADYGIHNP